MIMRYMITNTAAIHRASSQSRLLIQYYSIMIGLFFFFIFKNLINTILLGRFRTLKNTDNKLELVNLICKYELLEMAGADSPRCVKVRY